MRQAMKEIADHANMIPKKILIFELSGQKRTAIETICREKAITMIPVPPTEYAQTLGALAGIDGFSREEKQAMGGALSGEMLVFSGLDSDALDDFLDAYKQTKLTPTS